MKRFIIIIIIITSLILINIVVMNYLKYTHLYIYIRLIQKKNIFMNMKYL